MEQKERSKMKWLNGRKIRLMLIIFFTTFAVGGHYAKADFTFGEPTNLGPQINSEAEDGTTSISSDGLKLYFASNRAVGYGYYDIWVSARSTVEDDWENPVNLGQTINSEAFDGSPCISKDGLELYFESRRPDGLTSSSDIWVTRRATTNDPWGVPVNLGSPVNSEALEVVPSISADGLQLYFASGRDGGFGTIDIYVSTRQTKDDDWGAPINLGPMVNNSTYQWFPHISDDGRVLFFARGYPEEVAELWISMRKTIADDWGSPMRLESIMTTTKGYGGPCLAPDGSLLYFYSTRPGGYGGWDIWQAPIIPVVDLNGDGIVNATDMCIMVDHWGEDYSLCDIGPMPWGDGIVDVEDLIVLAEHLFEEFPPVEPSE